MIQQTDSTSLAIDGEQLECKFLLWGIEDMLRFQAGSFVIALSGLRNASQLLHNVRVDGGGERQAIEFSYLYDEDLKAMESEIKDFPVSRTIQFKMDKLFKRLRDESDGMSVFEASILIRELYNDVVSEMADAWFLMIPAQRRWLYQQYSPIFGEDVAARFSPEINREIASAGRCIALDEWTASVFHLMRVLEQGLREFANEMGIADSEVQFENWHNVIVVIEKRIRELDAQPRSPAKSETLQFASQAANNFRYFKDAWRNHVSHSRSTYDEREALNVFNHVRQFMIDLATRGQNMPQAEQL